MMRLTGEDAEFNYAIRKRARFEGKKYGNDFLTRMGDIRYKGSIELNGTLDFERGLKCSINSSVANLTNQEFRIKEVSHSFSKSGWTTTLTLEEDIEDT